MTDEAGQPTLRPVRSYMDIGPPSSDSEDEEAQKENTLIQVTRSSAEDAGSGHGQSPKRAPSVDSQTYYQPPSSNSTSSIRRHKHEVGKSSRHHHHGTRRPHHHHYREEVNENLHERHDTGQPRRHKAHHTHSARTYKDTQIPARRANRYGNENKGTHDARSLSGSTHTANAADRLLISTTTTTTTASDSYSSSVSGTSDYSDDSETSSALSSSSSTALTLRVARRHRRRRRTRNTTTTKAAVKGGDDVYDEAAGTSSELAASASSTTSSLSSREDAKQEEEVRGRRDMRRNRTKKTTELPSRRDTRSACVTEYDITIATLKARLQARLTADDLLVRQAHQQQRQHQQSVTSNVVEDDARQLSEGFDAVYRRHMDALVEAYLSAPIYRTARPLFQRRLPREEQRLRQDTQRNSSSGHHNSNSSSSSGSRSYAWTHSDVELLAADAARRGRFMDDTLPWRPIDFALTDVHLETLELTGNRSDNNNTGQSVEGNTSSNVTHAGLNAGAALSTTPVLGGCVNRLIEVLLLTEVDVPFAGSSMEINYTNVFLLLCPLFISAEVLVSKLIRFFRSVRRWQRGTEGRSNTNINTTIIGGERQHLGVYASMDEHSAAATEERNERAVYLQCRALQCLLAFCRAYETDLTLSCLQRIAYFAQHVGLCGNAFGELDRLSQRWPCSIGRCSPATSTSAALHGESRRHNPTNNNTSSLSLLPTSSGFLTPVEQNLTPGDSAALDLPVMQLFADLTQYLTHIIHKHYKRIEASSTTTSISTTSSSSRRYTLVDTGVPRDRVSTVALNNNNSSPREEGSPTGSSDRSAMNRATNASSKNATRSTFVPPLMTQSSSASSAYASHQRQTSSFHGRGGPMDAMLGSGLLVVRHGSAEVMPMSHWVRGGSGEEQWWHVLRAFDIDAEQFAHQLCLLSFSIFVNIPLREVMQHTWNDAALMLPTPHHLRVMLEYHARVQLWAAAVIVTQEHWDDCWRSLQHLLEVSRLLYDMQNYEMASAILQGLCHPSVQLLEKLYAEQHAHGMLSAKAERERATLQGLMDPFASYSPSSLNSIIARTAGDMETPLIPILAPILSQLRRYELTQGSTLTLRPRDGQLVVNWTKLMSVGSFASLWLRCQHTPYVFPMDPMLQDYLWSIKNHTWTDDMLLQMAQRVKSDSA